MREARRTASLLLGALLLAGGARAAEQGAINKAIDRGVAALKQMQGRNGTWPHTEVGATALAGLTLVECKIPADDPIVERAAAAVRQASPRLTQTYSLSLAILFLDRLGDPRDVPLIESLAVRLLAGQGSTGGWTYNCPPIAPGEVRRLEALLRNRNELKTGHPPPRVGKRAVRDLAPEIQWQLVQVARGGGGAGFGAPMMDISDNSNTQFANLALWVARRHGLPVDLALRRVEARSRIIQHPDGGWSYKTMGGMMMAPPPGIPRDRIPQGVGIGASPAMTCAGLLSLAYGHGTRKGRGLDKDLVLKKGLLALGTAIGPPPKEERRIEFRQLGTTHGKIFYFLWSLERVAVALNLQTIGKKDWYNWGADLLLASQQADGSWHGQYAACGADTCFALLFLRRANVTSDLTASLGKVKDPAEVELRVGGVGGSALTGRGKGLRHALAPEARSTEANDSGKPPPQPKFKPIPAAVENAAAKRLSNALVRAEGAEQQRVLRKLRDTRGADYTDALLLAIPRLDGAAREKAREALCQRCARLTAKSLLTYAKDADPELRRAALLASAMKDLKEHIPVMIGRLEDPDPLVVRAARAALKTLTEQDFGPAPNATADEHKRAIADWKAWWRKNGDK